MQSKLEIINYIKPNYNLETIEDGFSALNKLKIFSAKRLNFREKLEPNMKKLLSKYNIEYISGVENFWAEEILNMINCSSATHFYFWEEDTRIIEPEKFKNHFETMLNINADVAIVLDKKWSLRGHHLWINGLMQTDNNFFFGSWGSLAAKFCRETSTNPMINSAYPLTLGAIYKRRFLIYILTRIINSKYWQNIVTSKSTMIHENPYLPHSVEVCPLWWWPGVANWNNHIENDELVIPLNYQTIISVNHHSEEIGTRLIDKI